MESLSRPQKRKVLSNRLDTFVTFGLEPLPAAEVGDTDGKEIDLHMTRMMPITCSNGASERVQHIPNTQFNNNVGGN